MQENARLEEFNWKDDARVDDAFISSIICTFIDDAIICYDDDDVFISILYAIICTFIDDAIICTFMMMIMH